MSIFKEHKTIADRSATDRRRHKEKIEKDRQPVETLVRNKRCSNS